MFAAACCVALVAMVVLWSCVVGMLLVFGSTCPCVVLQLQAAVVLFFLSKTIKQVVRYMVIEEGVCP